MYCISTNVEAGLIYPKGILDLHIAALAAPEAAQLPLARRVTSIEPGHPQLLPLNGYSCQALSQLMPSREIFGPPNLGVKLKIGHFIFFFIFPLKFPCIYKYAFSDLKECSNQKIFKRNPP